MVAKHQHQQQGTTLCCCGASCWHLWQWGWCVTPGGGSAELCIMATAGWVGGTSPWCRGGAVLPPEPSHACWAAEASGARLSRLQPRAPLWMQKSGGWACAHPCPLNVLPMAPPVCHCLPHTPAPCPVHPLPSPHTGGLGPGGRGLGVRVISRPGGWGIVSWEQRALVGPGICGSVVRGTSRAGGHCSMGKGRALAYGGCSAPPTPKQWGGLPQLGTHPGVKGSGGF